MRPETELSRSFGLVEVYQWKEHVNGVAWLLNGFVLVDSVLMINLSCGTWKGNEGTFVNQGYIVS